jgi:hypothetical protein
MPYDTPDASDPGMLVGVHVPAGDEAPRELAYTFAEELASMGHSEQGILELFRNPTYTFAHAALLRLGAEELERIVAECADVYGRVRFTVRDAPEPPRLLQIE